MDLRHLRYFLAVAEEGHITGAAERLGIQQPPLSRLIRAMERELDVQLFRRKARGVDLTDAGRALHDHARVILADLDQALETTRRTARGEQGRIRVGVTPTGPFHPLVPRTIRAFREAFPQVSLTLEERLSSELIEGLQNGRIDAAFLWTPPSEKLAVSKLADDELVVVLPDNHSLAKEKAVPLTALAKEMFIIYGRRDGFGLFAATVVACKAAGFSPRFGLEAPRLASALSLAASGFGIFFVPASIQRVDVEGVTYRRLRGPYRPKSTLNLVSRRNEPSAAVKRFVELVRSLARDISGKGTRAPARSATDRTTQGLINQRGRQSS
jgi:DNA-binding transcriptional LysR family regulator